MKIPSIARVLIISAAAALPWAAQAQEEHGNHDPAHMINLAIGLPNGLSVEHPVIMVAGPSAKSAAGFLVLKNSSDSDDRLIAAEADFANTAQLHTHIMENDIAKMREVEGGFVIPSGGLHELARGGDHIMIMGLKSVPVVGQTADVTLTFEKAGTFTIPFMVMQAGGMHNGHK
jgi:copper(I)-binding protein